MILLIFGIACNYAKNVATTEEINYNEFIKLLDEKQISKVVISGENVIITPNKNNTQYKGKTLCTANIHDKNLIPKLQELGVDFEGRNENENSSFNWIFYCIIPVIIIAFLGVGFYALILLIKALKIYINKNS